MTRNDDPKPREQSHRGESGEEKREPAPGRPRLKIDRNEDGTLEALNLSFED